MTQQAMHWAKNDAPLDVGEWFDSLIDYWKTKRYGDLENAVVIAQRIGMNLSGQGLHKIRIELLRDALTCAENPGDQIRIYTQIALSQKMDG